MQNPPLDSEIRNRAMICHLLAFATVPIFFIFCLIPTPSKERGDWILTLYIVFYVLPLVSFILTAATVLIFWRSFRNIHDFIDQSGREVTNLMLSNSLYLLIFMILTAMTCGIIPLEKSIGNTVNSFLPYLLILEPIILFMHFLCIIIGSIQTRKGRIYRYPLSIQFFRQST
jgi:uncharacterized Tic20 family protein